MSANTARQSRPARGSADFIVSDVRRCKMRVTAQVP